MEKAVFLLLLILLVPFFLGSFIEAKPATPHVNVESDTVFPASSKDSTEAALREHFASTNSDQIGRYCEDRQESLCPDNLRRSARCIGERAELIIGLKEQYPEILKIGDIVAGEGGTVKTTIRAGDHCSAMVVEVPIEDACFFASMLGANSWVRYVEPNARLTASLTPSDSNWSLQWGPRKIKADYVWNDTLGSSDVLVAILDSGVDYTHPDLAPNYVALGYDWVNGDNDPMDDYGHGTHCAGILAAKTNNSVGIAGVAQVRIMAEKVLDQNGVGYDAWAANGIIHATNKGAKIISMSLGGYTVSETLQYAVRYAYDHGVLLVAAAGNEGRDLKNYPAAYDEVIAVGATDQLDLRASFSNYGDWLELVAPGVEIYSLLPGNSYFSASGTSMACPHVSGVAALVWSTYANFSRNTVRQILRRSADDLGAIGFDYYYGYGRVNAKMAISSVPEHDLAAIEPKQPHPLNPGKVGMFNVSIYNSGKNRESNISVQFLVNGTVVGSSVVNSIDPDRSEIAKFSWNTTIVGTYNITFHAVPVSGENYTENNDVSETLLVRFPTTLKVPEDYISINNAMEDAGPGDVISVSEGYHPEGEVDIRKTNLTLVANGSVVLNGLRQNNALHIKADWVNVTGFVIQNASRSGVYVEGRHNVIENNVIRDNCWGVQIYNSSYCTMRLNLLVNNTDSGLSLEHSGNNSITKNRFHLNMRFGIFLHGSFYNIISNNNVTGNALSGISAQSLSRNNTYCSNYVSGNGYGLEIRSSPGNNVSSNTFLSNYFEAVVIYSSHWNKISNNTLTDSNPSAFLLSQCQFNVLSENVITHSTVAIQVQKSSQNVLIKNRVSENRVGIFLDSCSDNNVTAGIITDNLFEGIKLYYSDTNKIYGNNITGNQFGIRFYYSSTNIFRNNRLVDNKYGFGGEGFDTYNFRNDVDTSNVVNGKPIYYWVDKSNLTVPSNASYVALINCENIVVENLSLCQNLQGIVLVRSSSVRISCNNIGYNLWGVYLIWSQYNSIYRNNFVNNTTPARVDDSYYYNDWDNGYPSGGNYWSNYLGEDIKRGDAQTLPGSDGFVDTRYTILSQNVDRYPLRKPWPWDAHDIGITCVQLESKTIFEQDHLMWGSMLIFNYGSFEENFNLAILTNETLALTTDITLGSQTCTAVFFYVNASGLACGQYTLEIYITELPAENSTADNTYTIPFAVTVQGDTNGDGGVNVLDLINIVNHLGHDGDEHAKYTQEWFQCLNTDVKEDGQHNVLDLILVAISLGQHW